MKLSYEEAEKMVREAFGENEKIPPICYAGSQLEYDPHKAEYTTDVDCLYIFDKENDTIWGIGLRNGFIQHKGAGFGCFWTEPEVCFEVVSKS